MQPFLIVKTGGTFPEYAVDHGDFEDWAAEAMGLDASLWRSVNAREGEPLPDPAAYAGCVITGSHDMVTEDLEWIHTTRQWLIRAQAAGLPLFGICFGHQLMAAAFGGEAGFHPVAPEISTVTISLTGEAKADPLFSGLPDTFAGHATHYQCALTLPPGAVLLAENAHEPHQAFRYGENAWGVQFHPEFNAAAQRHYVDMQREVISRFGGDADTLHAAVVDTPESAGLLKAFAAYCQAR